MDKQRIKASKTFHYLHNIIKDGASFAHDRVEYYLNRKNRDFFMNSYYNITVEQLMWYIENCNNLKEVHKDLLDNYKEYYANAWFENIIYVLGQ